MGYIVKDIDITNAYKVTPETLGEITEFFTGYHVSETGTLLTNNETIVPAGTYIVQFGDGSVKNFSESTFNLFFEEEPPLTFTLSELAEDYPSGTKFKHFGTEGVTYHFCGFAWVKETAGVAENYVLTPSDLTSEDWVLA